MTMSGLRYVFVHGLSGWGIYDKAYRRMPYWGMRGGDLMTYLREHGFDCYAASVAPTGSAWDRACELYAQLAGTRVDYGKAHSESYRHARYGRDYSGRPLIPKWDGETRLVLLGHSFGGATVRMFSELLAHGDTDERRITAPEELSPLFAGGMEKRIVSIVTLRVPDKLPQEFMQALVCHDNRVPAQGDHLQEGPICAVAPSPFVHRRNGDEILLGQEIARRAVEIKRELFQQTIVIGVFHSQYPFGAAVHAAAPFLSVAQETVVDDSRSVMG